MADRKAKITRKTKETDILVQINLDGDGKYEIDTGIGFLDHMLCHLSKHSKIDLTLKAKGDLEVDQHHTVEDVAICLGQALVEALGDKKGIARYGNSSVPMEDALANVAVDFPAGPSAFTTCSTERKKSAISTSNASKSCSEVLQITASSICI